MNGDKFNSKIDEYVHKFGSASRFVQKIIDSLDCPFAIVDAGSREVEVTNCKDFRPGMKCRDLFKCAGNNCGGEKCPVKIVVEGKKAVVIESGNFDTSLEMHMHPIFAGEEVVSVIIYGLDVTQNVALKESEEKYEGLFEGSADAIFLADIKTKRFIDCNNAAINLTKFSKKEILTKKISDLHPKEIKKEAENKFEKHATGEKFIVETEIKTKDNQIIPVSINSKPIKIGNKTYLQGIFRDITERKNVERELKESESKYHSLINNIPDVAWTTNDQGKTTFISSNVEKIYGYTAKEIYERGDELFFGRIHKGDVSNVKKAFGETFSKGIPLNIEYRIKRKDGVWIWLYDRSVGTYIKEGRKYVDGVFSDVTERKEREAALREREEVHIKEMEDRFYNILQNSQDLVYRYDFRKDCFDYVSESVFTILGYSLGEFMKINMRDYNERIHSEDVGIVEAVGDVSEAESVSIVEYRFKKKDGDYVWLRVQRVFFRDKSGELIYSIEDVRDISDEKLAEAEKEGLEERIASMKSKASETKERISLTDREKFVLWGFCRYPLLNDEELAGKLDLKRSTLTAIKNRLKGKNWFSLNYIPNFHKLGCQFFSVFDSNFKSGRLKSMDLIKSTSEVVLSNYQDNKFLGVFVSDKYVDFKRFLGEVAGVDVLKHGFNEDSFFYDLDDIELYDASGLINSLFDLKKKEKAVVYKFRNEVTELNTNEKRVLHAIIKDSDMSSSEIAKKIWTSKPTVIKIKKKLLDEGFIYPYVVPDFKKLGFSYVARLSFGFDSDLPVEVNKEVRDARVLLRVVGKNKITKIMLFASEEEYEGEVDLIKESYRKKGYDFSLNSEIFSIQKRRVNDSKMESYVNDKLFGDGV